MGGGGWKFKKEREVLCSTGSGKVGIGAKEVGGVWGLGLGVGRLSTQSRAAR